MTPSVFPDWTIFVQMAIFLLSYFILKVFVFNPFIKLKEKRENLTSKRLIDAKAMLKEAKMLEAHYKGSIEEVKKKAFEEKEMIFGDYNKEIRIKELKTNEELEILIKEKESQIEQTLDELEKIFNIYKDALKTIFMGVITGKRAKDEVQCMN